MTDRIIREDLRSAAVNAARNILAALDRLDHLHRAAFLWDASCNKPGVLRSIADAVRGDDLPAYEGMSTEERLAVDLYADVCLVDGQRVVEELGDEEPGSRPAVPYGTSYTPSTRLGPFCMVPRAANTASRVYQGTDGAPCHQLPVGRRRE